MKKPGGKTKKTNVSRTNRDPQRRPEAAKEHEIPAGAGSRPDPSDPETRPSTKTRHFERRKSRSSIIGFSPPPTTSLRKIPDKAPALAVIEIDDESPKSVAAEPKKKDSDPEKLRQATLEEMYADGTKIDDMLPDHGTPKSSRSIEEVERTLQEVPSSSNRPPSPIPVISDIKTDKWPYAEALRTWNEGEIKLYDEMFEAMKSNEDEKSKESYTRYFLQRAVYKKMAGMSSEPPV